MICPVCALTIDPRTGVVTDGRTTVHGRCHGKPFVEPRPSDEALVAAIAEMLHGHVGDAGTYEDLRGAAEKLAREISQVLLSRFWIERRT